MASPPLIRQSASDIALCRAEFSPSTHEPLDELHARVESQPRQEEGAGFQRKAMKLVEEFSHNERDDQDRELFLEKGPEWQ
jgi:hypothetical protein